MSDYKKAKSVEQLIPIEERYRHIRPRPQLPNFAAHIDGVDLTRPFSDAVRAELYQALLDFEVLFFAPQELTPEQHLELAAVFGPVAQGAYFPRKDSHPQIEVLATDADHPASVDHWHSDLSWLENPPAGTVIQLTEVPEVGGDTAWASMSKAFAALSPGLRDYLRGLDATHTWETSQWRNYLANLGEEVLINSIRQFKPVVHPVVLKHPESGKELLFVNETFTRQINGVSALESREILRLLTSWVKQPEFIYTHKWQANGIAVWDNRSTQHYALADYWPQRRLNHRVTFNARGRAGEIDNTLAAVGGLGVTSKVAYGY
ncbi:TauD/TfdA dioxygenase family protein [Azomonas macrocytogenes]|uniref:Taurine dioxygenase n=1 Tax=Azomonas macrocytogenes TaxID=69962 RepID=A0A839SZL1_AZOMA|nr:TauD/TfdA family dioxygenase [Azomonas macrocytogenes]MBB3102771.1 taurine dioxygenase [Azomonas macrocytogenes]